jgi:hypothetical protein
MSGRWKAPVKSRCCRDFCVDQLGADTEAVASQGSRVPRVEGPRNGPILFSIINSCYEAPRSLCNWLINPYPA